MKELRKRIDFIIKNPVKIDESKEKLIEESLEKIIGQ